VSARVSLQTSLFDRGEPDLDPARLGEMRRTALDDTAWVEHLPAFVAGQGALMDALIESTHWRTEKMEIYDRMVDVPRLVAGLPDDGPGHPLLERIRALLSERYRTDFACISLGYYRGGSDSVAWHGDRVARTLPEALVATVSLGGPRRFLLRPRGGGRSIAFSLGLGDLFVMGGSCQRTWQHAVPKVKQALPRVAIMFRPVWSFRSPLRGRERGSDLVTSRTSSDAA
jgi:alkylated DNA repair dioxygenase AlkB